MNILFIINNPADYVKMRSYFEGRGHRVELTSNFSRFKENFNPASFDEILCERFTRDYNYVEIKSKYPNAICIEDIRSIREYILSKETLVDKPEPKELESQSKGAQATKHLRNVNNLKPKEKPEKEYFIGKSSAYTLLYSHIHTFSPILDNFLLVGDSGTGKEHIAYEIHKSSGSSGRFVSVDCGVLTDELMASELFGHVRGSFTGAHDSKVGYFETANYGTLFLDEIENLSYKGQISLLRVLQERTFSKVGSTQEIPFQCKVICSTNVDLLDLVQKKRFRLDLYHRINQITLKVPALKDIPNDLPELIDFLIKEISKEYKVKFYEVAKIKKQAIKELHPYPGNIRQLKQWLINKAFENTQITSNLHGIELMRTGRL